MAKPDKELFQCIRKSWIGGNGTMYLGIPSVIVQKIDITKNSYLKIDVIDDIIIIKKLEAGFTKREKEKIQNHVNDNKQGIGDKEESNIIPRPLPDDFKNPLDDLDDI